MQTEENIRLAINGLFDHKLRSFLTMLGIIFGVASVIAMLSIGEGAKREAIAKYEALGVDNVIVRDKNLSVKQLEEMRAKFSKGLTLEDARIIKEILPDVQHVTAQAEKSAEIKYFDKSTRSGIVGVTPDYLKIINQQTDKGEFISKDHYDRSLRVCVLGSGIAKTLFPATDPVGEKIKIEDQWLDVIGVMKPKALFTETVGELASRDLNKDVYIPLTTFTKRFDQDKKHESEVKQITVKIKPGKHIETNADIIRQIVMRRHYNNDDFTIIIPVELLKQEERERRLYNILLGAIAAISLLVGGIGIMNIMLATVMERTREIGIRRAIGAKRRDIMKQFVIEAVAISITGGIIGVFVGVLLSLTISWFTDVDTFIRLYSVFVAFCFSVLVGVTFGYFPAKNASNLNPIESIRYE